MAVSGARPSTSALAGSVSSGLSLVGVEIDPRHNFVRGAYILANDIDKLSMSFKSFKEPLTKSLNDVIIPSIEANFAAQGRPGWQPLSPNTIRDRIRKGYGAGPILQRTGRLMKEATRKNIWEVSSDMLKLRTVYFDQKVPYAQYHQLGANTRGSGGGKLKKFVGSAGSKLSVPKVGFLPARPFVQLTMDEEVEIATIFMAFMNEKVDKYWPPDTHGLG